MATCRQEDPYVELWLRSLRRDDEIEALQQRVAEERMHVD
jgi:hypothetical protein